MFCVYVVRTARGPMAFLRMRGGIPDPVMTAMPELVGSFDDPHRALEKLEQLEADFRLERAFVAALADEGSDA